MSSDISSSATWAERPAASSSSAADRHPLRRRITYRSICVLPPGGNAVTAEVSDATAAAAAYLPPAVLLLTAARWAGAHKRRYRTVQSRAMRALTYTGPESLEWRGAPRPKIEARTPGSRPPVPGGTPRPRGPL